MVSRYGPPALGDESLLHHARGIDLADGRALLFDCPDIPVDVPNQVLRIVSVVIPGYGCRYIAIIGWFVAKGVRTGRRTCQRVVRESRHPCSATADERNRL